MLIQSDMPSLLRKVLLSLVCVAILTAYARSHYYRDPGSVFFQKSLAFEQKYSHYRKTEIARYFDSFGSPDTQDPPKAGPKPNICVGLNSVKRDHAQYLEVRFPLFHMRDDEAEFYQTTVASLLHGLTTQEREDLYIAVLVAESDPEEHPIWHEDWVRTAVDDIYTYNITVGDRKYLELLQHTGAFEEKGVYDYIYGLRRCYQTGAPYVGMFEDDVMLADGWLVRTLSGLSRISDSTDTASPWLFTRLFNQERSTGWANRHIGGNNEAWIVIGIALGVSVPAYIARRKWQLARTHLSIETLGVLVMVLNPALVVLFFQCGKASMLPPSPGIRDEPFGCCSQALVFPRNNVPLMIDFLQQKRLGQVDILLDELAAETGLTRYALYPVQAQHIGNP